MPELRKRSAERVAADKEFAYVREDIELFKKHQADKTISLNEKQRLKEQDEAEARQKARDKERLARPEPPEKVYEMTLKQADQPGLPPPVAKTNAALAKTLNSRRARALAGVSTNSASAAAPSGDNARRGGCREAGPAGRAVAGSRAHPGGLPFRAAERQPGDGGPLTGRFAATVAATLVSAERAQ